MLRGGSPGNNLGVGKLYSGYPKKEARHLPMSHLPSLFRERKKLVMLYVFLWQVDYKNQILYYSIIFSMLIWREVIGRGTWLLLVKTEANGRHVLLLIGLSHPYVVNDKLSLSFISQLRNISTTA